MSKRGRERTGTVEPHGDHYDIRPTGADGKRGKRVCMPTAMSYEMAKEKARYFTEQALKRGVVQRDIKPEKAPEGPTLAAWADLWLDDRQRRGLTSVKDDRGRIGKWVLPRLSPPLGSRPMRAITADDLVLLVEDIDERVRAEELSWKTAKNVWGNVTKMFKDATASKTSALRVRKDNPALAVEGPDVGVKKSKAYLYPAEFLALVNCQRVPIRWRRLFAWAIYTYERAGELEAQGVEDIDLAHRVNHVHRSIDRSDGAEKETKTNNPRRAPLEDAVVPLAERLIADARAAGRSRLLAMPPLCDLSARLRQYLLWAGVDRAELHVNDRTRKQITFHDLRATGITWDAIRGTEPMRIMHRAGHENLSTTMGYVREAEALEYLRGDVFPPLPADLFSARILPEGPAQWAVMRDNMQDRAASPAGFEPAQSASTVEETSGFQPVNEGEPASMPESKYPIPRPWAESRAEFPERDRALLDHVAAARRTLADAFPGDETTLLGLYLEALEDVTAPGGEA